MKISIVTVCFNSEKTIENTLKSVHRQDYNNYEHILIDGGSTDNTLAIIKQYQNSQNDGIVTCISEKDHGIYDAMNKGIKLCSGDAIGFLNSDDAFAHSNVLSLISTKLEDNSVDAVYGDLLYVDSFDSKKTKRVWKSGYLPKNKMKYGWHPPHPTFYVRANILKSRGLFDTSFRIGADYELMVRLIQKGSISLAYIPDFLVLMTEGGVSNKSFKNILTANIECAKAWSSNQKVGSPFLIPMKLLWKYAQTRVHEKS
jgi:glycosyltransferase